MSETMHILIGSQEDGQGSGITHAELDCTSGKLRGLGLAAEVRRPTWLLADPARQLLFSVSEIGNKGDEEGEVLSFRLLDRTRPLEFRSRTSSKGGGATHLALDQEGRLFVANFGGGNSAVIDVDADGTLSEALATPQHSGSGPHRRQASPHPHGVTVSPCGRFLVVPDMGSDQVVVHRFDPASMRFGTEPVSICSTPAGSGPRLLVFGEDGGHAYMLSELSAELYTYDWDGQGGSLIEVDRQPLDAAGDVTGEPSAAALEMSADGRFLYVSNRRTHSIQLYAIDERTGRPGQVQSIAAGGERPWHLALSPDGRWLLASNTASNCVQVFAVSPADGTLTLVSDGRLDVPTPTCVAFTWL